MSRQTFELTETNQSMRALVCDRLREKGVRLVDLFNKGQRVPHTHYEAMPELGLIRWNGPGPVPEHATAVLEVQVSWIKRLLQAASATVLAVMLERLVEALLS